MTKYSFAEGISFFFHAIFFVKSMYTYRRTVNFFSKTLFWQHICKKTVAVKFRNFRRVAREANDKSKFLNSTNIPWNQILINKLYEILWSEPHEGTISRYFKSNFWLLSSISRSMWHSASSFIRICYLNYWLHDKVSDDRLLYYYLRCSLHLLKFLRTLKWFLRPGLRVSNQ